MKPIYISHDDHDVLRTMLSTMPVDKARKQIGILRDELSRAVVVDSRSLPDSIVRLGSRVDVEDVGSGERDTYTLCLPWQANAESGWLSVMAPIGTALLGYGENDEIEWETPGGMRRLRIRSVSRPSFARSA